MIKRVKKRAMLRIFPAFMKIRPDYLIIKFLFYFFDSFIIYLTEFDNGGNPRKTWRFPIFVAIIIITTVFYLILAMK